MIRHETDGAISVGHPQTVVTAAESYFFQVSFIENTLILVDKLVVTVNGTVLVDQ